MATKDKIFSSKVKYNGFFNFSDFYRFCYEWLSEEEGFNISEDKYVEKLKGDSKDIEVEWTGSKEINDYFKFEIKVKMRILALKKVELIQEGIKVQTNEGGVEVSISGTLVKDYQGKFETTAFNKFLRGIYERWIIANGITAMEDKLSSICDEFLTQAKAYLDLEGKR